MFRALIVMLLVAGPGLAAAQDTGVAQGDPVVDAIFDEIEQRVIREYYEAQRASGAEDDDGVGQGQGQSKSKSKGQGKGRKKGWVQGIPPGHLPPPGLCRVWLPDTPPGHQPPPTDCARMPCASSPLVSMAGVPAFATGGSFLVGGFGGTDSQYVPIRATPGERVTVETPGQQQRAGGGGVNIQINNYSQSEVQAQDGGRGPDGKRLIYVTVRDVMRQAVGNGDMNKVFQNQFGLAPSPVRR